jgi:hypothetical protein
LLRSTFLNALKASEQLTNAIPELIADIQAIYQGAIPMTASTLNDDSATEAEDYTRFDLLISVGDVDGALEQSRKDAESEYRTLVLNLVEGRRIDPAKLHTTLVAANRTADDLRRHAGMINQRVEAIANRERADALAATLPGLQNTCSDANSVLKNAEAEYRRIIEPLQAASRTAAENFANADVTVKELRREAMATLSRTVGPEFTKEFRRLSNLAVNLAASLQKKIRQAEADILHAKTEMPIVEAKIAILEGQVLREENGGCNDVLIAQLNDQIEQQRSRYKQLANSPSRVEELRAELRTTNEALDEYAQNGVGDWRNINWSNDRPAWSAASEK